MFANSAIVVFGALRVNLVFSRPNQWVHHILKAKSNFTLFMYIPFRGICE